MLPNTVLWSFGAFPHSAFVAIHMDTVIQGASAVFDRNIAA